MIYIATYIRESPEGWPVDHGDDPSFRSSKRLGGRVTWGVCQPNVRKMLQPGDGIVFFAADRLRDRRPARYQFVGFATVDRGVRQTDIWDNTDLRVYRDYANLLIRPGNSGFVHSEPELPKALWHGDWLWRIADTRGFRKSNLCGPERFSVSDRIDGRPDESLGTSSCFGPSRTTHLCWRIPPLWRRYVKPGIGLPPGADLADVQYLLGHKSPKTTQRYAKVIPAKVDKVVREAEQVWANESRGQTAWASSQPIEKKAVS